MCYFILLLFLIFVIHNVFSFNMPKFGLNKSLRSSSINSNNINRSQVSKRSSLSMKVKIGVVGATGAVGQEIISVMDQRSFKCDELTLFSSSSSAGKQIKTNHFGDITLQEFTFDKASKLDMILLAVGGDFSLEWAEKLADAGVLVIDNSSAFRRDPNVPLVIPEINIDVAKKSKKKLIANPNCTTAIALMALAPLHKKFGLKKVIMSTYQAASGAGAEGMKELEEGSKEQLQTSKPPANKIFAHPLPFNLIPHIDVFQENLYTKEEMKVTWETLKILNADENDMKVSCTAVRIPIMRAHSEAITIETSKPITSDEARRVLSEAEGITVVDDIKNNKYPMPINAMNKYDVEVGRIRESIIFEPHGIDMFVSGDQLLRGAALNAVLIAEQMI